MSKFKKKGSGELPKISTASLPDIVFMLLFFFMVATVLRDNTLLIQNTLPAADQVQKLDKKDRVIYIYAGKPSSRYQDKYCLLYTSPSPRDRTRSRMPSSA